MSKYIATVRYSVGDASLTEDFAARAKSAQHVKEQYHRYTHENYGNTVSREHEDQHIHPIGEGELTHELVEVTPVNHIYGMTPIQRL